MSKQHNSDTTKELQIIAENIRTWQLKKDINNTALCANYDIGSTKTFLALADGNTAGYNPDRWLPKYRTAWNLIQAKESSQLLEETLYDDIYPAMRLRAAFADAMRETGNDRLIIIEGNPGCGKSSSVDCLVKRYGSRIIKAEAAETWRDSINAMLSDLLRAVGIKEQPVSGAAKLDKLIEVLCVRRRGLVIDEAHHMGPRGLNIVKTIINRTPGEVIMMGLPVLLKRLERDAYQEARQLTLNRLCERIKLSGVDPDDAARILERTGGIPADIAQEVSGTIATLATDRGALKFVARVARHIANYGEPTETPDSIIKHATRIAAKR